MNPWRAFLTGIFLLTRCFGQSPTGYTISGVVVQHASDAPIRHVRVFIAPVAERDDEISVVSGNAGEFSFSGLPPGKYTLAAEVHGSAQAFLENEGYSTAIAAGPNLDSQHIVFPIENSAAITGTVLDEEGDPVPEAQVLLFRRGVFFGRPRIVQQSQANTNSAGEFHFRHLRPGTYFIAAQGRPWFAEYQPRSTDSRQMKNLSMLDVAFPLTYYGGATSFAGAAPLSVAEGSTVSAPIVLRALSALHIVVEGLPPQSSGQWTLSGLSQAGPGGIQLPSMGTQSFTSTSDGIQEMNGMTPGDYILSVQQTRQGEPQGRTENLGTRLVTLTSDTTIDVSQLQKTAITGQITFTDGSPQPLNIRLGSVSSAMTSIGEVEPDGSFRFQGQISPGHYALALSSTGLYMKTIAVKGADFLQGELDIHAGATVHLSIAVATGLGRLEGVATKDGKPIPGAMVLLIPQDFAHGTFIPQDQTDSDGTFTLPFTPPGRYTLLAIDDGRDLAYHDSTAMASYLKLGQAVEMPFQGGQPVKVEVLHRQP